MEEKQTINPRGGAAEPRVWRMEGKVGGAGGQDKEEEGRAAQCLWTVGAWWLLAWRGSVGLAFQGGMHYESRRWMDRRSQT